MFKSFHQDSSSFPNPFSKSLDHRPLRSTFGAVHILAAFPTEQPMPCCPLTLAALFLVSVSFGLFYLTQRRRWRHQLQNVQILPETLPTGESLAGLTQHFQHAVNSDLLGRRLAWLYAVLFDPDLIHSYIKDPYLTRQVETRNIENNTALFLCMAAVEEAVEGRAFRNDPANTVASYLRGEFKKRGWKWPKHAHAWQQHFLTHHTTP